MLYLAPLQGFTDYIYRQTFSKYFEGVDAYFIPYISINKKKPVEKQLKEILPENNPQKRVVPQILFKDADELDILSKIIADSGFNEINLNLGCPYPMVTNQGKGSGLLPQIKKLDEIFESCSKNKHISYSVKLRSGLISEDEIFDVLKLLNQFNFSEIIYHPRIAKQLYAGEIKIDLAKKIVSISENTTVLNGDIFSKEIFEKRVAEFPSVNRWMLGRGILRNPFLAEEISGITNTEAERIVRLAKFHDELFYNYSSKLSGSGHLLVKMQQFWFYFSESFKESKKVYKQIKKSTSLAKYNEAVRKNFAEYT